MFLTIHTSTSEQPPSSVYHIIKRQPPSGFTFQKLRDPVDPFGSEKVPHHMIIRLKDFAPNLQDLLVVCSTASTDVGLLTRSKTPLSSDLPEDKITGVFTTTELADDSRRAQLPMSEEMDNTIPVGAALDLSSKEPVYRPIPADEELESSAGPLPGYWVLNHEGVLLCWWIVYDESVRQRTTYSGFGALEGTAAAQPAAQPQPFASAPAPAVASPFVSSPFGAKPAGAFGVPSALGAKASPWGTPAATTTPSTTGSAFGAQAQGGWGQRAPAAFGQASALGSRPSPWASGGTAATPAFGVSGFASIGAAAPKAAESSPAPAQTTTPLSGGFANFARHGGFAAVGSASSGGSIFGTPATTSVFGSGLTSTSMDTAFPAPASKPAEAPKSLFSGQFKLGTTFTPDKSAKEDTEGPASTGPSLFGKTFGDALSMPSQPPAVAGAGQTEEMEVITPGQSFAARESTTPTTTPPTMKDGGLTQAPSSGGLFGSNTLFGGVSAAQTSPFASLAAAKPSKASPLVKTEEPEDTTISSIPEAPPVPEPPLPPDTVSKTAYPLGDSSSSSGTSYISPDTTTKAPSKLSEVTTASPDARSHVSAAATPPSASVLSTTPKGPPETATTPTPSFVKPKLPPAVQPEEAPLPPDFLPKPRRGKPQKEEPPPPPPPAPSPPRSGEGEEEELSEEAVEAEGESELGSEGSGVDVENELSPSQTGLSQTGLSQTPHLSPESSFDVVANASDVFASLPGKDKHPPRLFGEISRTAPVFPPPHLMKSPRSPSPVRGPIPPRMLSKDSPRSVSAPGMASHILAASSKKATGVPTSSIFGAQVAPPAGFVEQQKKAKARQEAEERQPLVDEEDEAIQQLLRAPIEPTLTLDEFIAHSNGAPPAKDSIPAQVEAVYKDINSMIDTLGLNARALQSFILGHSQRSDPPRTADDLDDPDIWVLCDAEDLERIVEVDLSKELADAQITDFEEKKRLLHALKADFAKLRVKQNELHKLIAARADPGQASVLRSLPLSAEQATQQNDLRREFAEFSKLLTEAEEALVMLKAKLASVGTASGKGSTPVPTVEAIMRTISRMTSMIEKRSGDVDVLENQMRRLRLGSVGAASVTSREGSPFATPPPKRGSIIGVGETPVRGHHHMRNSLSRTMSPGAAAYAAFGTPPRKKLTMFTEEEKAAISEKQQRRARVLSKLQAALEKNGPANWPMDDAE